MSERLSARSIETIRSLTESFPYNTFPNMLLAHIDALEAESTRLRKQVEAADALAVRMQEIRSFARRRPEQGKEFDHLCFIYARAGSGLRAYRRATATEDGG